MPYKRSFRHIIVQVKSNVSTKKALTRMHQKYRITYLETIKLIIVSLFLLPVGVWAQIDDDASSELLENFFRDNESATESDAQLFLEYLERLQERPLNLNTATREDLENLRLLNAVQIENLIAYRDQFGPFLSAFELQAVPTLEIQDIRRILPFTKISSELDTRNTRIIRGFSSGQNELQMRFGYAVPPNYSSSFGQNTAVEGRPFASAIRYRHNFDNRLRFGFTAESDPGEAIFAKSNPQGFDFYSAHLFAQNLNKTIKAIALGDYSARFGQGLLLQTGFSPGKSAETVSIVRGGRKINAYGAFGETFFFRGAAASLNLGKHVELTALYSHRRRDGNVQYPDSTDQEDADIIFTSLQSSGYHRTASEIADEKALTEQVAGLSASWQGKNGQIGVNGLYISYDKPWSPSPAAYRQFAFTGKTLTGTSIDYNWRWRNFFVFGETARSDNGAIAAVNGLLLSAHRNVTLSAVHRSLAKDYQSIYAAPFAESSGGNNEKGLYLGADIRWERRWQFNFYADAWRHPWLRFGVSSPSTGREFLAKLQWQKSKSFLTYLLWQTETKESDSNLEETPGLVENRRDRLRLHVISKVNRNMELRSRIEVTRYQIGDLKASHGYLAYQEAVVKILGSPLTGSIRYSIFDTRDYDTRVYTYENDLFSAVSIPAFAGRGSRYYLNLRYKPRKWLILEARMEQTNTIRAVTSTGTTGKKRFWKIQARFKW
ncbi:MAG: helix-hairpin-helix domain-containing protein [Saprospiraceae bacterium]|nr:helix-hairpin-helix domain-containing protein [Saprospiraceae bacterium]